MASQTKTKDRLNSVQAKFKTRIVFTKTQNHNTTKSASVIKATGNGFRPSFILLTISVVILGEKR